MTDPDITIDQEEVLTPSRRKGLHLEEDQYLIPEGLRDHVKQTGNHLIGEDLHLILQARSPDQDQGPRAEAGTPINLKVTPLLEDLHPSITEDLIHQIINAASIHTHLIPGEDISLIRSSSSKPSWTKL